MSIDSPVSVSLAPAPAGAHAPPGRGRWRRPLVLLLLGALLAPAATAATLRLQIERIEGPGMKAERLDARLGQDGRLSVELGRLEKPGLPPLQRSQLRCSLQARAGSSRCSDGRLRLRSGETLALDGGFTLDWQDTRHWQLQLGALEGRLSAEDAQQRWVAQQLQFRLSGALYGRGDEIAGPLQLELRAGEALLDPVYLDLGAHPLQLGAQLALDRSRAQVALTELALSLGGLGTVSGRVTLPLRAPMAGVEGRLAATVTDLDAASRVLLQPFVAGTRWENMRGRGRAQAELELREGRLGALALALDAGEFEIPSLRLQAQALTARLHWQRSGATLPSEVRWQSLRLAAIETPANQVRLQLADRDLTLLQPLRLPLLDGALHIRRLALANLGQPQLKAAFDAELEPVDLAALCRALGWPEFGGRLAGRLPGLRIENERLSLDGALEAEAFDGRIRVEQLRVLQPFGPLPRVMADLRLRRLDLQAVTQAFDFGRIEGRLDGDVTGLRLLRGRPVAMDAHLYSTPGDRSRRRISQRAIESISRAGGGPAQVLSRTMLRIFEDFPYARIGWRCQLANGVCDMSGLGPHKDGYLLVQGRGLPRIDVVGHARRVNWNAFLDQLQAAMAAEGAEIR